MISYIKEKKKTKAKGNWEQDTKASIRIQRVGNVDWRKIQNE